MKFNYITLLLLVFCFISYQQVQASEEGLVLKNQQGELFELNNILGNLVQTMYATDAAFSTCL